MTNEDKLQMATLLINSVRDDILKNASKESASHIKLVTSWMRDDIAWFSSDMKRIKEILNRKN